MLSIPFALSISYATYLDDRRQGLLARRVDGRSCVVPGCSNIFLLTDKTVVRGAVWLEDRRFTYESVEVSLARCRGAGPTHTIRVLPADLLPLKVYSVPAQEGPADAYLSGGSGTGLRGTLAGFEGDVPHASTLHGWVGGLGRLARERDPQPPGPSFAEVRQEVEQRISSEFSRAFDEPVAVSPRRYAADAADGDPDESRRDDLEFATRLLRAARAALPAAAFPLGELVRLLLAQALVAPISWWARIRRTPIRHRGPARRRLPSGPEVPP